MATTKFRIMTYTNELKAKLATIATGMEAIVNTAKKENNRGLTSEEREKFHNMEADYSAIEDSIKIAAKNETVVEYLAKNPSAPISSIQLEEIQDTYTKAPKGKYDVAFSNYLRNGERTDTDSINVLKGFRNAQTLTTSGGGYIIPTDMASQIELATKWFGGVGEDTVSFITTTGGNALQLPLVNDTTNKGRYLAVNTAATETDLSFGQLTLNSYICSSDLILYPRALAQDAVVDVQALVAEMLGIRMGRLFNNKFTLGSGTNEPTGIITAATTSGNLVTAGGSTSSGEVTSVTYTDLVNLEHAVDPSYRYNPKTYFMFSDTMLKTIKKLVDGQNRPLWLPGLTTSFEIAAGVESFKPTILGHPYKINSDIAVPAASAYTMLFGDLSKYLVRQVANAKELVTLHERYAEYNQTAVFGNDGKLFIPSMANISLVILEMVRFL